MLAAAAVLVALIAASGASAKRVHVHVNIKDQNGYRMSIEASRSASRVIGVASSKIEGSTTPARLRALSRQRGVQVAQKAKASRPGPSSGFLSVQVENHHAISTYGVQGTVTHNRLFGKLGDFGRISLRFHLRHTRTEHHGCRTRQERLGVFRGRVHFRGEDDYVNIDANELKGKVETGRGLSDRCRVITLPAPRRHPKAEAKARPSSEHHKAHRYTFFFADKESKLSSTFFGAIKETRKASAFLSDRFELKGPVLIDREEYGETNGKAGDFKVSKGLRTARIEPSPRAFRGSGHFRAHHKRNHNRWKGSLATSFPGAHHVRLAGPNFEAELRQLDLSRVGVSVQSG
jgi:hypothetical protein